MKVDNNQGLQLDQQNQVKKPQNKQETTQDFAAILKEAQQPKLQNGGGGHGGWPEKKKTD